MDMHDDDLLSRMSDGDGVFQDSAVIDDDNCETQTKNRPATAAASGPKSPPPTKTRSLSDGGGTPTLSPSPHIFKTTRPHSKDDIGIRDKESINNSLTKENSLPRAMPSAIPSTPTRAGFQVRGLALQLPPRDTTSPAQQQSTSSTSGSAYFAQAPLSPKLDHSHIYASPTTNILPRRSRGLDFSRAATSLHHSTLADQASPDSSPTIGSRAMNIPSRRNGEYGNSEQGTASLWGMMGNQERMHISSSLGSNTHMLSESSSSSDDDDFMDEDMDEGFVTTPMASKMGPVPPTHSAPWMPGGGSPAVNSLLSFQQRQRQRKQHKKKMRAPLGFGLGFTNPAAASSSASMSKSPPGNMAVPKDLSSAHARRESISWAANQLHISGSESDDNLNRQQDGIETPSRPSVIRRAVTRRGNLLPKTKGFARIRAALAEESAPIETEVRREAEVVRQVLESDMDLEPRLPPPAHSAATTALSSPNLATHDSFSEAGDDAMMVDSAVSMNNSLGLTAGPTGTFKQQVLKNANSKGKNFWDTFSESSVTSSTNRTTPPPLPPPSTYLGLPRASSSAMSMDDISMDSPSAASSNGTNSQSLSQNPFVHPNATTRSSSGNGTPGAGSGATTGGGGNGGIGGSSVPSAAEITRRINSKRRRDDDFDPVSIKRRAVSPGMSVQNSPIMQSPLQRDMAPWGSRPGSVGGDTSTGTIGIKGGGGSGAPSENGSYNNGSNINSNSQSGSNAPGAATTPTTTTSNRPIAIPSGKRIGFQGMVDTNDGITRLSIE
ncbi:hypothetical protein V8F20_002369 [Naviculisporaceae sp. PSN 640]